MVRWLECKLVAPGKYYIEAAGKSTDSKPTTDIVTGSKFKEVDTGKKYVFEEESGTWIIDQ